MIMYIEQMYNKRIKPTNVKSKGITRGKRSRINLSHMKELRSTTPIRMSMVLLIRIFI